MRLLDRYLLRELLSPLGYCLGGFLIFWISFDLFTELSDLQENKLRVGDIIEYYLVKSPEFLVEVLPIALLLALRRQIHSYHADILAGAWQRSAHFTLLSHPLNDVQGNTLGIFGYGHIGQAVARRARGFAMTVLYCDDQPGPAGITAERVSKEELLAKAKKPAEDAMRLHAFYRGKMETVLKCRIRDLNDFAIWYTPGVAAPCKAIQADPEKVYEYTNKWNTVAVVSDGTRVLGLGDIGPKAGLPVMEGKALLYKYLGGVDGVPIMLDTKDPDAIINTVLMLQPGIGGVNLEDIAQPKCFYILDTLRKKARIPVWHDDQQGTAAVTLAGLINALKVVGKKIEITCISMGNPHCVIFVDGVDNFPVEKYGPQIEINRFFPRKTRPTHTSRAPTPRSQAAASATAATRRPTQGRSPLAVWDRATTTRATEAPSSHGTLARVRSRFTPSRGSSRGSGI